MAITTDPLFRRACLDGGLGQLNQGAPDAAGDLEFLTAADGSLAVLPLSTTAFQAATMAGANAQASSNTISPAVNPTPGTIAKGRLRNRSNNSMFAFSVGLVSDSPTPDMVIAQVVIPPGATSVSCSGLVITAAFSG